MEQNAQHEHFFSVWRHDFFVLSNVHSQRVYLQEKILSCILLVIEMSPSDFFYSFDKIKSAVSFPLEDIHVANIVSGMSMT